MTAAGVCCQTDPRRALVRAESLNGIDYIEVDCAQTQLTVTFLGRAPDWITPAHIRIEGGRRERDIRVLDVRIDHAEDEALDDLMIVTVDRPGDFSTYRLVVLDLDDAGHPTGKPPTDFDVRYTSAAFGFKVGCPVVQDPADVTHCPEPAYETPAIDYLAKDYHGFRRLMLDRLALTMPEWSERHAPDIGITLVEILAYVADDLSYYQDAVATEAYLGTARLRTSVRRHVRLVDYHLDEGRNAQGWARITLHGAPTLTIAATDLMLTTALPRVDGAMQRAAVMGALPAADVIVFEPDASVTDIVLHEANNEIQIYTWDGAECCLPAGTTCATLVDPGSLPDIPPLSEDECNPDPPPLDIPAGVADGRWHLLTLRPGDVLILAEIIGPRTGASEDADPAHRHAIRLTAVRYDWDPLPRGGKPFGTLLVHIDWCPEDALPFPLCLSAIEGPPGCELNTGVSVAWGNIVAVDHGRSIVGDLGTVVTHYIDDVCDQPCAPAETIVIARRFRPQLPRANPTFVWTHDAVTDDCGGCGGRGASRRGLPDAKPAVPAITLTSTLYGETAEHHWTARADLLDSAPDDRHFVVETADDGGATLRFGDGRDGRQPAAGERFTADYRVGSGPIGNLGADALKHMVFRDAYPDGVALTVGNPLAMRGGTLPETTASARLRAPHRFRDRLERAITAEDYAAIVLRDFGGVVQGAAASLRATGVRTEVQIAVDALGSAEPDPALLDCIARHLDGYRRIGHDVRTVPARLVPIELELHVCVAPDRIAEHVRPAILDALAHFFHPDALGFGQGISMSVLMAAMHAVEGVALATIIKLNRLFELPDGELAAGLLSIGPLEIARLDQDPDAPENGELVLTVGGGR